MLIRDNASLRLTADQFAGGMLMKDNKPAAVIRAGGVADLANSNGRLIRYLFSDPAVARDRHTITGWKLDNFRANPVFLWAHQGRELPIGKVVEIDDVTGNGRLVGSVEYAERDLYPFADTVFQLVRGGYVNAVSTSWDPIKWKFSTDRNRPGGIDFELVDLLELSQVPVPAVPNALATARANGIDTGPVYDWAEQVLDQGDMVAISREDLEAMRREAKMPAGRRDGKRAAAAEWKVGASQSLPLNEDLDWDGSAAAASIFEKAGFDGDKPDVSFARKGFLVYDASAPELKGSYKLPFAKVIDGRLTALASGIRAAASRLPQADLPGDVADKAREVIDHYEGKMKKDDEKREAARRQRRDAFKRDLYHVGWLAYLLSDLDCLEECVEWEAAIEEDGSPIPAQLSAVKKQLGEILVAMAGEEVAEMNSEEEQERAVAASREPKTPSEFKACVLGTLRGTKDIAVIDLMIRAARPTERAGKVLSSANARTLRDAHEMMTRGCDLVRGVFEQADEPADDTGGAQPDEADAARGRRQRLARARQAQAKAAHA